MEIKWPLFIVIIMIEKIKNSLKTKSILYTCLMLSVILLIITAMNVVFLSRMLLEDETESCQKIADLVMTAIRYPMLRGEQEVIQMQFDQFKTLENIEIIHLLDEKGVIKRSTDVNLLGKKSESNYLNLGNKPEKNYGIEVRGRTGKKVFTEIDLIWNEKNCYACHGSQKKVLGLLKISLDWESVLATIKSTKKLNILVSFFALVLMSFFTILFLLKVIILPIKNLALGMNIVSSGDLNHKILIKSKDEIGQLAGLFNKMTQDLRRLLEREKEFAVLDVEKKKAAELLKLNNDLKQEIIVRKKIEERLEKYSRELERRNIELNDVTHIISHEFKEPLRSINAYSGFIIKEYQDKLDENGVKYLERLKINTGRLQEIFENFLAYQSIEMREDVLKEIESEELIKELIAIHDYKIKQKNVQIIIRDGLPKVLYNREWLATVFIALISNAIKFNEKKNPIIEIGCKLKGDFYEFYLKDNGPGIDKQYFDNIFMIFKTLSKKEEYSGTGIGLTIVKKIVELNNGKVWLESELGQGSIFYFTIPIKQNKVNG